MAKLVDASRSREVLLIRERVGLNPTLPAKRRRSRIVTMNEWKILEVLPDGYYEVQCPSCDKKICLNVQDRAIVKYCCCCGIRVNFRDQKKGKRSVYD
jgi:hypothetical protein